MRPVALYLVTVVICRADPPCPLNYGPAVWRSRVRMPRCMDGRTVGELRERAYPEGMPDEEKALVDGYLQVFARRNLDDEAHGDRGRDLGWQLHSCSLQRSSSRRILTAR